jgi:hypothetical protein
MGVQLARALKAFKICDLYRDVMAEPLIKSLTPRCDASADYVLELA